MLDVFDANENIFMRYNINAMLCTHAWNSQARCVLDADEYIPCLLTSSSDFAHHDQSSGLDVLSKPMEFSSMYLIQSFDYVHTIVALRLDLLSMQMELFACIMT